MQIRPGTEIHRKPPEGDPWIERLEADVNAFNACRKDDEVRAVLEFHSPLCRCSTCWYTLGSADRVKRAREQN